MTYHFSIQSEKAVLVIAYSHEKNDQNSLNRFYLVNFYEPLAK